MTQVIKKFGDYRVVKIADEGKTTMAVYAIEESDSDAMGERRWNKVGTVQGATHKDTPPWVAALLDQLASEADATCD